ncbi:RusA-like resolvase [Mycobacterium phage MalagasyRose]|uniref:RusA-like resolvase n=1 Tax=Mycobacterium phage MalagasyRose TaxID=2599870 RepID=A0A5J6TER6_9CAUD|nr:RusA-like resolvase [Mycobacterium phage MalagasyRose]QFG08918.1 RusA-like resolvase [Mycobacterium phage MalagasyRose]
METATDLGAPERLYLEAQHLLDMLPEDVHEALREALCVRVTGERNGARQLRLFVPGKPAPQGSKAFKGFSRAGTAILKESSDAVGPWRERIALQASQAMMGAALPVLEKRYAVTATVTFVMPRPASAPKTKTPPAVKRPDLDKLARAVLDGLTDVVWADDSQVVDLHCRKVMAAPSQRMGAHIRIASPGWGDDAIARAQAALAGAEAVA